MKARLLSFWEDLRTSYWFIPSLLATGAIVLSFFTVYLDHSLLKMPPHQGWIWRGGPDGARDLLSTLASSMITVAGVVFSITLVALTLASSQFGPRLLRNFVRDVGNQIVLGTFISTFLFCLLVLRTVHKTSSDQFVPHISITCALVLAVISLALLIYYIHHVADSIQADNMIARVGIELETAIKENYPENGNGRVHEDGNLEPGNHEYYVPQDQSCSTVHASCSGYLQVVDTDTLKRIASQNGLIVHQLHHPGDFIAQCNPLVEVYLKKDCPRSLVQQIEETFIIGKHRTPTQDIDYAIHQLVEIAVRALSPGVNDPYTAIACIDWLGAAMNLMTKRKTPSHIIRDDSGEVRIISYTPTFSRMFDSAFNQIRQYGKSSVSVMIRLLETFSFIADNAERKEDLEAVRKHAEMVLADSKRSGFNDVDLTDLEQRFDEFSRRYQHASAKLSIVPYCHVLKTQRNY